MIKPSSNTRSRHTNCLSFLWLYALDGDSTTVQGTMATKYSIYLPYTCNVGSPAWCRQCYIICILVTFCGYHCCFHFIAHTYQQRSNVVFLHLNNTTTITNVNITTTAAATTTTTATIQLKLLSNRDWFCKTNFVSAMAFSEVYSSTC